MNKLAISTPLLAFWILMNFLFQPKLDDFNESLTIFLQRTLESNFTNFVMNAASKVIVAIPLVIIFLLHYHTRSVYDSLFTFAQIILSTFINTAAKMVIRENRPFFERDDIKALSCECNYAMPSGHSNMISITVLCMLATLMRIRKESERDRSNSGSKAKGVLDYMGLISFASFFFLVLVVFSRIYFGVHTFSQIVMGFLLALFLFDLTEMIRPPLRRYVRKRLSLSPEEMEVKDSNSNAFCFTYSIFGGLCLLALLVNILLTRIKSRPVNEATKRNSSKCSMCTYGLMIDTISGILVLYALPSVFLAMCTLATLKPKYPERGTIARSRSKSIKRGAIFLAFLVIAAIPSAVVYKILKKHVNEYLNQVFLFLIFVTLPFAIFIVPIYILRCMFIDYEEDYVNLYDDDESSVRGFDQKLATITDINDGMIDDQEQRESVHGIDDEQRQNLGKF